MAGKATIVAQVYSYTISNYAKERKKLQYINICLAIKIWRIVVIKWAGLWLGQLVSGHSNMINCFPFPARIILSHRMLSFIIWSCDQNFHYCDQLTEHAVLTTQNGDPERICCMFVNQADSLSMEFCQRKQIGTLLSWLFLRIHTAAYSQHVWTVILSGACCGGRY